MVYPKHTTERQVIKMVKTATSTPVPKRETREGLKKNSGDVVGFRDPEKQGVLYGIPRAMKANDSKLEPRKPSIFVIFELLEDCKVTEGSAEDATEIVAKKGDMVGLWVKGGMRNLRNMGGLKVLVQYVGEKKLKDRPSAQSPMKVYDFDTDKPTGTLIPLIEDNRKESRDVVNAWLPAVKGTPPSQTRMREPGEDEDEDAGF
jgi:hypothetical protein